MSQEIHTRSASNDIEAAARTPTLLSFAIAVLLIGLAVYVFDRTAGSAVGLPKDWHFGVPPGYGQSLFGIAGSWLPSLVHVLGFSLLSVVLLPRRTAYVIAASTFWMLVNVIFEVLQHPALSRAMSDVLRVAALPGSEFLERYLVQGRFDIFDIAAALIGGIAAIAIALPRRPCPRSLPREPK